MYRRMLPLLPCLLLTISTTVFAQQFSADYFKGDTGGVQSKIYVGSSKARIDGIGGGRMKGAVILDLATRKSTVLMPERHMYMETMPGQFHHTIDQFFRPSDPENACVDWMKMATTPGGTCTKVGHDTVNGRDTVKYKGTSSDGKSGTAWVDTKLDFVIKWQEENGRADELRNIQEGSQPASLFEVPADYRKMDMGGMMGRMPQQ